MIRILKVLLPIVAILVGALIAFGMIRSRPDAQTREVEPALPLIRTQRIELADRRLMVRSQGTVRPRTESNLVPEVGGRIVQVSPSFVAGGYFGRNDLLLSIDRTDYLQALVQAEAAVAQAELRLATERAEGEIATREWEELGSGEAPALTARVPQLAEATAQLRATEAQRDRAARDLERTAIRAPYAGRVRSKQVDLGQFVTPGVLLASIYSVDKAEVRLPLADDELAFVDLPLGYRGGRREAPRPPVTLIANFGGKEHRWKGRIVRTEGEIDPLTRMVHAVAEIEDPYGQDGPSDRPPLAVGLYVEAEIEGREVPSVVELPRSSLRDESRVLVVDDEDRLRFREVSLLRMTGDTLLVSDGLEDGERVCLTPLVAVSDGMRVRTEQDDD